MTTLRIGDAAPDFELSASGGTTVRLKDFRGKTVVLYFYPRDDTSGCTREAIDFSRLKADFAQAGAEILGVSADNVKSHDKFAKKHKLDVALASDPDKSMLQAYGVWTEKKMYGLAFMGIERTTLLVGPDGRIVRIWPKVKVPGHAEEVLEAVRAL